MKKKQCRHLWAQVGTEEYHHAGSTRRGTKSKNYIQVFCQKCLKVRECILDQWKNQ